jgi:hypothetical protein
MPQIRNLGTLKGFIIPKKLFFLHIFLFTRLVLTQMRSRVKILLFIKNLYLRSTARQTIQNCQTSPVDFQRYSLHHKELDGRAVSALGVRSRKLSTGLNGQS